MRIAVIGAGPAGLIAASAAAQRGAHVVLFEKNPKPGRKLLMTGNGRCNVTNLSPVDRYPEHYFGNGKFLYKALNSLGPGDIAEILLESNIKLRVESDGRAFPESGKAKDILDALVARADRLGVRFRETSGIVDIRKNRAGRIAKAVTLSESMDIDVCILCTGGSSYPITGSSGDGYLLAARLGHTIVPPRPALAPVETDPVEIASLQGVSIHGTGVRIMQSGICMGKSVGDVLFTHFGLSGPAVLNVSRYLPAEESEYDGSVCIELDLWPDVPEDEARDRLMEVIADHQNSKLSGVLKAFWPEAIIEFLFGKASISADVYCRDFAKEQRKRLLRAIKQLSFRVRRAPLFSDAMVTTGGVSLKEVDPRTMQSKIVQGLYFAGEVLDIDGNTGGYNLQAAFSTGYLAGFSAAARDSVTAAPHDASEKA